MRVRGASERVQMTLNLNSCFSRVILRIQNSFSEKAQNETKKKGKNDLQTGQLNVQQLKSRCDT